MQIQPIDITQIIVAIITAVGVVCSVVRPPPPPPPVDSKTGIVPQKINLRTIIMLINVILLVVNLGIFGWRYWGHATKVEITYPNNGVSAEVREMVRGTSQKIPKGQAIWIVVYPHIAGRYHPQNDPADIQANGDWASLTFIGIENDVGNKFDIIVVLADKNTQDTFKAYLTQSNDKKVWLGLEKLPEGATVYNRITVTRK